VLRSDTIWVLTPTHSIGFNDNTVHCINAYNKCYTTIEVQVFSDVSWLSYLITVQPSAAQYLL